MIGTEIIFLICIGLYLYTLINILKSGATCKFKSFQVTSFLF
jgi:hypothetical protein